MCASDAGRVNGRVNSLTQKLGRLFCLCLFFIFLGPRGNSHEEEECWRTAGGVRGVGKVPPMGCIGPFLPLNGLPPSLLLLLPPLCCRSSLLDGCWLDE